MALNVGLAMATLRRPQQGHYLAKAIALSKRLVGVRLLSGSGLTGYPNCGGRQAPRLPLLRPVLTMQNRTCPKPPGRASILLLRWCFSRLGNASTQATDVRLGGWPTIGDDS